MDSDLQDPPELLDKLIKEYEKGAEVVHTVRTKRLGESKLKLLITKIAYKIINFLSDINLPTEAGDYKLISKKALTNILEQREFRPYIRGLSVWVGFKQSHVEYVRDARSEGATKFPLLSAGPITQFISGVTAYSLKPLYFGIILGIISIYFFNYFNYLRSIYEIYQYCCSRNSRHHYYNFFFFWNNLINIRYYRYLYSKNL